MTNFERYTILLMSLLWLFVSACGEGGSATDTDEADMATDSVAIAQDADAAQVPADSMATTIVGVAGDNELFSTLLSAIQTAELVNTLDQPGPYTVFAPINSAFEDLPEGTLETLLDPANQADLKNLLTYHVVPGKVMAADLLQGIQAANDGMTIRTLQGGSLTATMQGDEVILIDAAGDTSTVISTDISATNGVVHGVDAVLMVE